MIMRVIEWILIMCFGEKSIDVSRYTTIIQTVSDVKEFTPIVQFGVQGFTLGQRVEQHAQMEYNAMMERKLADAALRERRAQFEEWRKNNHLLFAS